MLYNGEINGNKILYKIKIGRNRSVGLAIEYNHSFQGH